MKASEILRAAILHIETNGWWANRPGNSEIAKDSVDTSYAACAGLAINRLPGGFAASKFLMRAAGLDESRENYTEIYAWNDRTGKAGVLAAMELAAKLAEQEEITSLSRKES